MPCAEPARRHVNSGKRNGLLRLRGGRRIIPAKAVVMANGPAKRRADEAPMTNSFVRARHPGTSVSVRPKSDAKARKRWTRCGVRRLPAEVVGCFPSPHGIRIGMTSPLRTAAPYGRPAHRLGDSAGRSPGSRVAVCVRPSRLPSGQFGRGLAAYSCGGSHGLLQRAVSVFPLSSSTCVEEPARRNGPLLPRPSQAADRKRSTRRVDRTTRNNGWAMLFWTSGSANLEADHRRPSGGQHERHFPRIRPARSRAAGRAETGRCSRHQHAQLAAAEPVPEAMPTPRRKSRPRRNRTRSPSNSSSTATGPRIR